MLDLALAIKGGGKRARGGLNKEARAKQLRETIGMNMMRLNAAPQMSPQITNTKNKISALILRVVSSPTTVLSDIMRHLTAGTVREIITVLASGGNNSRNKFSSLAQILFRQDCDAMDELKKQVLIAENLTADIIEASLVAQYSDEGGDIKWSDLGMEASRIMADKITAAATGGAAAPSLAG